MNHPFWGTNILTPLSRFIPPQGTTPATRQPAERMPPQDEPKPSALHQQQLHGWTTQSWWRDFGGNPVKGGWGGWFLTRKKKHPGVWKGGSNFRKKQACIFFGVNKKLHSLVLGGVGGFKYFECSPGKVGQILHFDSYFSNWVGNKKQPRTVLQPHFFPYWKKRTVNHHNLE